jgi:hypothetical protein
MNFDRLNSAANSAQKFVNRLGCQAMNQSMLRAFQLDY